MTKIISFFTYFFRGDFSWEGGGFLPKNDSSFTVNESLNGSDVSEILHYKKNTHKAIKLLSFNYEILFAR